MYWISHLDGGPKRVNHAAVAVGYQIYTFGGYCSGENMKEYCSIDVHVLNTQTFRWHKHPVSDLPYFENDDILPYKRYGHTVVYYNNRIYIWGGRNDRASCSTLFCFDLEYFCWSAPRCSGDFPLARDGHTACMWKNKMIIFGGYEEQTDTFAENIYILDLDKMHWSIIRPMGPTPPLRDFQTAVCIDNKMYLFGGRGTEESNVYLAGSEMYCSDLWYLDLVNKEWRKPETIGKKPIGRRSHSAFVYEDKMYIFGGFNALKGQHYNDMYEFNPQNNEWKEIKPNGLSPCERRRQACILVGDRVFLFGGTSPSSIEDATTNPDIAEEKLIDHSDMYVLDFKPTLKTLCLMTIKQYELDLSEVPDILRNQYRDMFTSNKLTINRPVNSGG